MVARLVAHLGGVALATAVPPPAAWALTQVPDAVRPVAVRGGDACTALALQLLPNGRVLSAIDRPAAGPAPAHCEIIAELDRRTGSDGQPYAVGVHLRLPASWNGRFFFQGGGGSEGELGDALGNLQGDQPGNALQLGYAVASTDGGHANAINKRADRGGVVSFGWDQRAREDYAGRAQARATIAAKTLVEAYYGRAPIFSYWVGCSKGGQEGTAMTDRYPDYYDGVIANAPAFALPRAAVAEAWDTQSFAVIAPTGPDGQPRLGAAFSHSDLALVANAINAACDTLDGAADGIVANYAACTASRVGTAVGAITCAGAKTDACITAGQAAALGRVFGGPRDGRRRPLYSDWAWDPGLAADGWRAWKLGRADSDVPDARNVTLGASSLASVFVTPPVAIADQPGALQSYQLAFSMRRDAPSIYATSADFPISSWALLNVHRDDREAFRRHGGKLIVAHGVSDPVFSVNDTLRWWDRLDKHAGGRAATFARVFPVPGMNHCRGGPGTTRFEAFSALVAWVEQGRPPDFIAAEAPAGTPWPGRTRPLCPYPGYARYDGPGSVERMESFRCASGARISSTRGPPP